MSQTGTSSGVMSRRHFRIGASVLRDGITGFLAVLVLHLQTIAFWGVVYSQSPWPGYERAMALGLVDAHFLNSPLARLVTRWALCLVGVAVGVLSHDRQWARLGSLLSGSMLALFIGTVVPTWMWSSNLAPLFFVVGPFTIGVPIVGGFAFGSAFRWSTLWIRGRSRRTE